MIHKKHFIFLALSVITALISSNSMAKEPIVLENIYVETDRIGSSIAGVDTVYVGYRTLAKKGLIRNARFEQEISYNPDSAQGKFMSNLMYDFKAESQIKPYVGVGAGFVSVSNSGSFDNENKASDEDIIPAYQITSGVTYEPESIPSIKLQLGYSYAAKVSDPSFSHDPYSDDYSRDGHSIAAALRFKF